jgi:hypothetical protein
MSGPDINRAAKSSDVAGFGVDLVQGVAVLVVQDEAMQAD